MAAKNLFIIGAGGFAKEAYLIYKSSKVYINNFKFIGFIDNNELGRVVIDGYKVIGDDNFLKDKKNIHLVIGIGNLEIRKNIFNRFNRVDVKFPNFIHQSVNADWENIRIGKGNIISSLVSMDTHIKIGDFNCINKNCTIGHDVSIADFCQINPGSNISGFVQIENNCLLGSGSNIYNGMKLSSNTVIGMGASLFSCTKANSTYVGNPAKKI
ncbi:MAG: acetyltransferase [Rhodothermaceae bacterium]